MSTHQLDLLKTKRFLPLFLTQFFGAFNDNLFKNALVILITYRLSTNLSFSPEVLITMAAGIFILPFFLFSALAGQLADKFEKSQLIRITKVAEVILMSLVGVGFYLQSVILLMLVLFFVGTQATFFGPMKYSILPDELRENELIAGNALLEAGTYLAILLGTLIGGVLAIFQFGTVLVSIAVIIMAVIGLVASRYIPATKIAAPSLKIKFNIFKESMAIVKHTFSKRELALSILGISWFWLVGATYLSQFPTYTKNILQAEPSVVTLFLTVFSVGIGVGSLICNRLLKGKINATYVPMAAIGMALFGVDLVLASQHTKLPEASGLISLTQFLSYGFSWRILIDLLCVSIGGGIYIVPLYAILQHASDESHRSRAVACNNILNAMFMVGAALITSLMFFLHFSVTHVFLVVAAANLLVAFYICNLLPEALIKSILIWLCKVLYRVEVRGMENYEKAGHRVLIIANHSSLLDAVILAAFLPDRLTFAVNTEFAKKWWMQILLKLVNTYSVDPTNPLATKSLISYLRQNKRVVIFPEGRITVTGALMKIYEGPGLVADKANAPLLPIRIDGAQQTVFSYLKGKIKLHWFPKITMTILEPRRFDLPDTLTGRERRSEIGAKLYDVMTDMIYESSNTYETLFQSVLDAKSVHGARHKVIEDIERKPMSYAKLVLSSFIMGRKIAKSTARDEFVGILLPNSIGNVVTFFALQAYHRVPAMLNFTAGKQNLISACQTAKIRFVYTSRQFIERANLQNEEAALLSTGVKLIYLEDVKQQITLTDKLYGKLISLFPKFYYHFVNGMDKNNMQQRADQPAVVLFTSGSEGVPKGVVLSHINLQANRFQLLARVDFGPADKLLNFLPMFHSFGLNCGTLLPIVTGMRVFLYPSPLHYRIVPEVAYDIGATVLFGTDTFLSGYAKYAHAYNFYSIRYAFAGAEKLREETRELWAKKFGVRVFEGYGVTETAPVISMNTAMQCKAGTVGRILPGMRYKFEHVEGIEDGARFFVSGANIMKGYLLAQTPGVIVPPKDGWHDTGDIVAVDEEGFITIKGRAKRFAKIAGEMVSLAAVEEAIYLLWPDDQHAVIALPDSRKGEQIVLMTTQKNPDQVMIIEHYKQRGISELAIPRKVMTVEKIPLLGSGKTDYTAVKNLFA